MCPVRKRCLTEYTESVIFPFFDFTASSNSSRSVNDGRSGTSIIETWRKSLDVTTRGSNGIGRSLQFVSRKTPLKVVFGTVTFSFSYHDLDSTLQVW